MKKKILITGVSGFIGKNLFNVLKKDSNLLLFGTKKNIKNKKKNVKRNKIIRVLKLDLSKFTEVKKLFFMCKPDIIFHFAALSSHNFSEKNKKLCRRNNSKITKNLVRFMPKKCKIIYLSTDKIYSRNPFKSPHHTNLKPLGYLAKEKLRSEKIIMKKTRKYFILRLPIVHKNGESCQDSTIDNFLYSLRRKKKVHIYNNISRSFLKVDEFIIFLNKLIYSNKFGIYNVGSQVFSYSQRVENLCKLHKINYRNKIIETHGKIYPVAQNFDVSKVNKEFNFFFS